MFMNEQDVKKIVYEVLREREPRTSSRPSMPPIPKQVKRFIYKVGIIESSGRPLICIVSVEQGEKGISGYYGSPIYPLSEKEFCSRKDAMDWVVDNKGKILDYDPTIKFHLDIHAEILKRQLG